MSILLTGGTGLVGSRLVPRLAAAGFDVRVLLRRESQLPAGVKAVLGDLLEPESLVDAVSGVDAIIHLAATFRRVEPEQIWKVNLEGTRNLIGATLKHAPQARFMMASTGNVYGSGHTHPARESDPTNGQGAYPESKVAAEAELRASALNWSILRLPFVYGEGDGHLQALPDLASRLNYHPARTMSMLHHRDIAVAFQLALAGRMDGQIVNIADDAPVTVYEIVRIVGESYKESAEPVEPWEGWMDVSLVRELGFVPTIPSLHQAVRDHIL